MAERTREATLREVHELLKDMEDHARIKRLGSKLAQYCSRLKRVISNLEAALATPSAPQGVAFDAQVDRILKRVDEDARETRCLTMAEVTEAIACLRRLYAAAQAASATVGQVQLSAEQVWKVFNPHLDFKCAPNEGHWIDKADQLNALLHPSAPPSAPAKETATVKASDQYFVSNPQNRATLSTARAEYTHKHPEATPGFAAPAVQPEAQVMKEAQQSLIRLYNERIVGTSYKKPEEAITDFIVEAAKEHAALVTRECNAARLAALEQAAQACEQGNTGAMFETSIRESFARTIRALAAKEQTHD